MTTPHHAPRRAAALALALALAAVATATPLRAQDDGEGAGAGPPQGPPPSMVRLAEVLRQKVDERRFVTGEVRAVRRSRVAGRESGLVLELPVREGQSVARGDVLARVDDALLQLEKTQLAADREVAEATLAEQEAEVALARWQRDAQRELSRRGSGFEQELQQAEAELAARTARLRQAEGQIAVLEARDARLRQRLEDTVIHAPFDGVVVSRVAEAGEWLGAGDAVVELLSAGDLEAWFELPERLAGALGRSGVEFELLFAPLNRRVKVDRFRIVPRTDDRARTFPLIVPLDGESILQPGMSASAWVPAGTEAEHLTVPKDALLRNEVGYYAYVARGAEGAPLRAVPASVERLFAVGDRVAVRSAQLHAGDRVVVEGNERLFPQAPIAAVPAAEPAEKKRR